MEVGLEMDEVEASSVYSAATDGPLDIETLFAELGLADGQRVEEVNSVDAEQVVDDVTRDRPPTINDALTEFPPTLGVMLTQNVFDCGHAFDRTNLGEQILQYNTSYVIRQKRLHHCIACCHRNSTNGIQQLISSGFIFPQPTTVVQYLWQLDGRAKQLIDEVQNGSAWPPPTERDRQQNQQILVAWIERLNFMILNVADAIRLMACAAFISGVTVISSRTIQILANRIASVNKISNLSAPVVYQLCYSAFLLDVDHQIPDLTKKITAAQFLADFAQINVAKDVLVSLFENVKMWPLMLGPTLAIEAPMHYGTIAIVPPTLLSHHRQRWCHLYSNNLSFYLSQPEAKVPPHERVTLTYNVKISAENGFRRGYQFSLSSKNWSAQYSRNSVFPKGEVTVACQSDREREEWMCKLWSAVCHQRLQMRLQLVKLKSK
eukprot:c8772_g1_i2.p1 GENE.c8772_g1_i2~~c8772_g1_i2.p1  ORF type:complete len:434 (+),score=94.14 c8772_g1_i2:58-1359(+)